MAKASDSFTIRYEGYYDLAEEVTHIGEKLDGFNAQVRTAYNKVCGYHAVYHQLRASVVNNLVYGAQGCAWLYGWLNDQIPRSLRIIAMVTEEHEKAARGRCHRFGGNAAEQSDTFDHEGMADGFYAEALAAAAATGGAGALGGDAAGTTSGSGAAGSGVGSTGLPGSSPSDAEAEILSILGMIAPTAAQEYQDRITEAQFQALMEYFKDDPVMLEKIKKDYEAWKKARAEAAKLAELGLDADALGGGSGYGDLGSDSGGGFGGGSDLGLGDSDWGGGGGLDDLGSDWASEDWASDLLDDSLDTDEFEDASSALGEALGGGAADAVGLGAEALADAADLGEGSSGMFGAYGPKLAAMAEAYGLQAVAVAGGAVALYATREQTTEAVARVAEFVSTKCKPAVDDVMDQLRGTAKKTRVDLANAKSNVTAAVRGERAGDLIG